MRFQVENLSPEDAMPKGSQVTPALATSKTAGQHGGVSSAPWCAKMHGATLRHSAIDPTGRVDTLQPESGRVGMDVRTYAKVVGVIIVLIGVGGLVLGEQSLLGVLNIDIAEDIVHLVTGGLMAAVGFRGSDSAVRSVVGGLGIVYLIVGVLGIFVPGMFGLLPSEYETVLDNLIHLTLGVLGIVFGFFVGRRSDSRLAH